MRVDAVAQPPAPPAPDKVRDAAQQFEALLLGQMLKDWMGAGEDQAAAAMMEFAEEHMARVLASQGGLGLANLVVSGLEERLSTAPPGTDPS